MGRVAASAGSAALGPEGMGAGPQRQVGRIHRRGGDADLAGPGLRLGPLGDLQDLRPAETQDAPGFHGRTRRGRPPPPLDPSAPAVVYPCIRSD